MSYYCLTNVLLLSYYSVMRHISLLPLSYASYNCSSFWLFSTFMISTSRSTFLLQMIMWSGRLAKLLWWFLAGLRLILMPHMEWGHICDWLSGLRWQNNNYDHSDACADLNSNASAFAYACGEYGDDDNWTQKALDEWPNDDCKLSECIQNGIQNWKCSPWDVKYISVEKSDKPDAGK